MIMYGGGNIIEKKEIIKMVKRSIRAAVKAAPRKKNMVSSVVASHYMGGEPTPVSPNEVGYQSYLIRYYNWANVFFDTNALKEQFMIYAKNNDFNVSEISSLDAGFFMMLGKISYLFNKGYEVSQDIKDKFDNELFYIIDVQYRQERDKREVEPERVAEKHLQDYWNMYSRIDLLLPSGNMTSDEMTKLIDDIKPNVKTAKLIQDHYSDENWDNVIGVNKGMKQKIKNMISGIGVVSKHISAYLINLENTKSANRKPRKTRTIKAKPASRLIEKLTYKKNDSSLNFTSINPESIIGAKALLVFNTKTRKFGTFVANKDSGLMVKGTTIIDFDENKSICKTLRKPDELIPKLTGSTLKRTELLMKDIKAVETKLKGRINEDILLCKVFK